MKLLPIIVLTAIANAQPAFEVATVKLAKDPAGVRGGCHGIDSHYDANEAASAPPLGRCVIRDGRLDHMLSIAYHLRSMAMIQGGPDWARMGGDRFNVEAKVEDPTKATEEQLYQMLQALLTERFSLKFRREVKDMPGYALVVGKNGPKFKEAKGEEASMSFGPNGKPGRGPNSVTMRKYSMSKLADLLTNFGNPILDKTGLTGDYDFTLAWDEDAGPTLYTALHEQLGLKLEPQKVPVLYIVIESAQKPSEN
jgi:uncharacterized protein (TIGR03435 family)